MTDYPSLLLRVDEWYRDVKKKHPEKVPCERGCRECCLGLFDISQADRDLLREGLAKADAATRKDIQDRARAILDRVRQSWPDLEDTLDGWDPDDIDALCDSEETVECPVLGPQGECRLYEYRPLTCRMSGVPVVDVTGETVYPEGCAKCTLKPSETPRLDCTKLRKDERRILKRAYGSKSGVTLTIPQAMAGGD